MALLRLQPGHDADDLRAGLHPVLVGQRAARLLVVVALEVDAVVDEVHRDDVPALLLELALDRAGDRDEPVHVRGQPGEQRLVVARADPAGVDRRHEVRPAVADLAEGHDGARPDRVGAVHVGVEDVGAHLGQVRRQRADRDRVVDLVDDEDRDAGPLRACGRRSPPTARRPRRRSAARSIRVTSENRCSWAPPLEPVASSSTTRTRPPVTGWRITGSKQGSKGIGAPIRRPAGGRAGAGSARRPRPTRTCRARRRGGSRAAACRRRSPAGRRRGP